MVEGSCLAECSRVSLRCVLEGTRTLMVEEAPLHSSCRFLTGLMAKPRSRYARDALSPLRRTQCDSLCQVRKLLGACRGRDQWSQFDPSPLAL